MGMKRNRFQRASGEELLVMAVFADDQLRRCIDGELDRRAVLGPSARHSITGPTALRAA